MNLCIIAPGHDEFDHRVNRATQQLKLIFDNTTTFLEKNRVTKSFQEKAEIKSYNTLSPKNLITLKKNIIDNELLQKIKSSSHIYIHDSGLYGVFLTRYINKYFHQKKVIFDYHDLIEWEVQHHIYKILKNKIITKILYKPLLAVLNYFFIKNLNLQAIIGISDGQISKLTKIIKNRKSINCLSIPNTRIYTPEKVITNTGRANTPLNLIWVGNIGANRSIETGVYFSKKINENIENTPTQFLIIGKHWGSSKKNIKEAFYLGKYKSDNDVINKLPSGINIGIFFGWQDDYKTNINEIASPNKIYTYINIGLPFLIPSSLENIISHLRISDTFIYTSEEDFIHKALYIKNKYLECQNEILTLKKNIEWDADIENKIKKFYIQLKG